MMQMNGPKPGDRVGVMISVNPEKKEAIFVGYGIYEGDFRRPESPTFEETWNDPEVQKPEGLTKEQAQRMYERNPFFKNPRMKLDSGEVAWGCEVWWGSEKEIKDQLEDLKKKGFTIKEQTMKAYRASHGVEEGEGVYA